MEPYLEGFNTVDAISQLTLAELWSRDAGDIIPDSFSTSWPQVLSPCERKPNLTPRHTLF